MMNWFSQSTDWSLCKSSTSLNKRVEKTISAEIPRRSESRKYDQLFINELLIQTKGMTKIIKEYHLQGKLVNEVSKKYEKDGDWLNEELRMK